jgi:antitoxin ParD1/3/4
MTVKPSVSLSDDQHAFAKDLVARGRFSSISAVLQHGLELLREREAAERLEAEALRALLARRRAGPMISTEEMSQRVEAIIERKRRDLDLAG